MNAKKKIIKSISYLLILITQLGISSLAAKAVSTELTEIPSRPQMINLNMQFKAKNQIMKSSLTLPFYQKAEIEKIFDGNNNIFIEVNPRYGKTNNEISIEMKFSRTSHSKAFAVKEIISKFGEESMIKVKGMTVKVTPVL